MILPNYDLAYEMTSTSSPSRPNWWIIGENSMIPPPVRVSYALLFHLHYSDDEPPLTLPLYSPVPPKIVFCILLKKVVFWCLESVFCILIYKVNILVYYFH